VPDAVTATAASVRAALASDGSVGVIAPDARVTAVVAALAAEGIGAGSAGAETEKRVTVLPASLAKGLEYDHVIAAEPAEIVSAEQRGLHRLYVVLTRAVSSLTVLQALPLPDPLR
jgi:superfamily I DNA/RNA helicase